MKTYAQRKEAARQAAIDWQLTWYETNYSYCELDEYMEYFEKLARRFGLVREFRENAII